MRMCIRVLNILKREKMYYENVIYIFKWNFFVLAMFPNKGSRTFNMKKVAWSN